MSPISVAEILIVKGALSPEFVTSRHVKYFQSCYKGKIANSAEKNCHSAIKTDTLQNLTFPCSD